MFKAREAMKSLIEKAREADCSLPKTKNAEAVQTAFGVPLWPFGFVLNATNPNQGDGNTQ